LSGKYTPKDPILEDKVSETRDLAHVFDHISFHHVFRIWNKKADALAKEAVELNEWEILEFQQNDFTSC
jgi:hypothetical protein